MRIGFVVPDDATAWLYYRHLMEALTEAGAEITVLSAPGPYVERIKNSGFRHVALPYARFVTPLSDIRLAMALRKEFVRHRFDVVQNFTVKANLYGAWAAASAGVPAIINTVEGAGILWSTNPSKRVRLMRDAVEAGLKLLRRYILLYWFVNRHDRDLFVRREIATVDRSIVAISTGVDTDTFNAAAVSAKSLDALRQEIGIAPGVPVLTMVAGRLLRSKGVEAFVELGRQLRSAGIRVQLVLVGPEEADHPDALDRAIVTGAVGDGLLVWTGYRDDIPAIYALSDIVVVPTTYAEGIAKSVVEPMAMALPVICSFTPAIDEMVEAGVDAIVLPANDDKALFDAVMKLLTDEALRNRIGAAARRSVELRFDARREATAAAHRVYSMVPGWRNGLDET
ncbi:MAG: glycosyltransferase [Gemmatimonadaceae bacterium]